MTDMILYLLKVAGLFSCFTLIFYFFFRRLSFHQLNRWLLLAFIPLSFLLPSVDIGWELKTYQAPIYKAYEMASISLEEVSTHKPVEQVFAWPTIVFFLYLFGALLVFSRLVYHLFQLFQLNKTAVFSGKKGIYYSHKTNSVFSSFGRVYLPSAVDLAQFDEILAHEKAHTNFKHSWDILIAECFHVLFWFNPLVMLFQKMLKDVHEYQADAYAIRQKGTKSAYLQTMLDHLISTHSLRIASNFKSSTIKNRIEMITDINSRKRQLLRYLIMIPIIGFTLCSFALLQGTLPKIFPIKQGEYHKITAPFGMGINPITKENRHHRGIDISAKKGTNVMSTGAGKVILAQPEGLYGNLVVIDHGEGYVTKYAHLHEIKVTKGQQVTEKDIIGTVGSTGQSTGAHLHYEVLKDDKPVDPYNFF